VSSGDRYGETANGDRRGSASELEPIAVIDIGSNSVRLVVYEGAVRSPTPLFNEKVLCGLGRSVASTGKLGADSVDRALAALGRFRAITRILGVKNVRAIATAAVREAADGREFIARGVRAAGTDIQVLSGEREAELAASGILMGFRQADGIAGDLGGGSLELIDIAGGKSREATTLPLGGLRLIDTSGERLDRAQQLADDHLGRVAWLPQGEGRTFYAVGGTWRALARLHMDHMAYPLRVMHGYRIDTREAIDFCEDVRKARKLSDIAGVGEIPRPRREVLPYGALVLERLLRRAKPEDVVFSVFGIREGLLFSLLSEIERRKDPLISFAEDYARLHSRSADHARELCTWTDALFQPPGPKEADDERRLRHAACLLSDIGWRAHPDYRGAQSLNVVAHAGLGGIDHEGRVFLALTIYFRHTGAGGDAESKDELSQRLTEIVSKRTLRRARILGAAIRAAHMLSIGRPGIIDEAPVAYEGTHLTLTIPRFHQALDGERLRRRFEALAHLLEREPEIRIAR
jgi:exopolyphosphatase / guanosine-5'-triphosphate,3'-diphosphate pyrophosphatase